MGSFLLLSALSIARESARVILKYSSFLTAIAAALIFPTAAATFLSHPILDRVLVSKLAVSIQAIACEVGFPQTQATDLICFKLSQTISSYMFCFPFIVTFSLVAKAAVTHTVVYAYAGYKPSSRRLFRALPRMWKRLLVTYSWICLVVLGSNAAVLLFLLVLINIMGVLGFSFGGVLWGALLAGVLYSVVFAHAMIVCNLATVVCVVEDCYGIDAVFRARFLIKGRVQIAFLLSLITSLSLASVEGLFRYRVMGIYRSSTVLLWEGPLLIFMYSLVVLMDTVMTSVFYCTRNSCRWESCWDTSSSEYEACACEPSEAESKLISEEWIMAGQP